MFCPVRISSLLSLNGIPPVASLDCLPFLASPFPHCLLILDDKQPLKIHSLDNSVLIQGPFRKITKASSRETAGSMCDGDGWSFGIDNLRSRRGAGDNARNIRGRAKLSVAFRKPSSNIFRLSLLEVLHIVPRSNMRTVMPPCLI